MSTSTRDNWLVSVSAMEEPLSVENLLKEMNELFIQKHQKSLPKSISSSIEKMVSRAESSEGATRALDTFSKQMSEKNLVKIVSADVPAGILPPGHTGILHDTKVSGWAPDDEIYSEHPNIRRMIPRGTTIMNLDGSVSWFDVVLYANKKFTGGVGDEDDSQPANNDLWKDFFLQDPDTADQVVCMTKINGKAAHFSGRYILGHFYVVAGSKNVHMLMRERKDIDLYAGDRYTIARLVAESLWDTLQSLDKRCFRVLCSLLHHTKCTAVCEILQPDNQHIVNNSDLEKNQLYIISFTPTVGEEETSLLAMPPHHSLDLISALGCIFPLYSTVAANDVLEHRNKVRKELYKEGEVMYFLNKKEETIGLVKTKTTWYIMMRALREKTVYCFIPAKKRSNWDLQDCIKMIYRRFGHIQEWLKFSDSYLLSWKKLGETFLQWMDSKIQEKKVEESSIRPKFPKIWHEFLSETGHRDDLIP
ncbi:uncharacterized protein [Panulirus ornatus]|uniref:uncharacterized protein isoform X2 n=1 Tax=Panulirus ornatus TaxID=150431 RepID=UPI003A885880